MVVLCLSIHSNKAILNSCFTLLTILVYVDFRHYYNVIDELIDEKNLSQVRTEEKNEQRCWIWIGLDMYSVLKTDSTTETTFFY